MIIRQLSQRTLLALLILFLLTSLSAYGQGVGANRGDAGAGGRRSIKGKLYLPGGSGDFARFRIRLDGPDVGTLTTFANSDGEFVFNGVLAGSYNLFIEETAEYEAVRESVYIEGVTSGPVVIVPIYLRRKPSADPAFAGVSKVALDAYIKATEASRKGDRKKAIALLKTAIDDYERFVPAYTELAVQYLKAADVDKALEALDAALKISPYDFDANLNSGIALLQKKNFVEAERPLRIAIEKRSQAATPRLYLGIALLNLKRIDEAQQELETTISLPGGNSLSQAHRYLGGIYWSKRDYKRAADHLETYLRLNPKAPDAEKTRAAIKDLRGKKESSAN